MLIGREGDDDDRSYRASRTRICLSKREIVIRPTYLEIHSCFFFGKGEMFSSSVHIKLFGDDSDIENRTSPASQILFCGRENVP